MQVMPNMSSSKGMLTFRSKNHKTVLNLYVVDGVCHDVNGFLDSIRPSLRSGDLEKVPTPFSMQLMSQDIARLSIHFQVDYLDPFPRPST